MLIIHTLYFSTLALAVSARPARSEALDSTSPFYPSLKTSSLQAYFAVATGKPDPRVSLADAEVRDDSSSKNTHQNESYSNIPIFNPLYSQKEIRAVAAKYAKASQYLQGEGLSILPNFTQLASQLPGDDPTAQVAGSTFVLSLQTYGADLSYYGQADVGTPSQGLLFDLDTGSSDLWVPSNCPACNPSKVQFDSKASSTYEETGKPFRLAYGTGDVEGIVAMESIALGPFSIDRQYFGAVSKESDDFAAVPFDGIIGMAFSSISATGEATFMERVIQERQINAAVFGVHLTRHEPRQSEACIGCYDPSKYTGAIAWNSVTSKTYWNIAMANIRVNGVDTAPQEVTAAIDTGTSLIYLPQDLTDGVYSQMPGSRRAPEYGAGLYTYPCALRPIVSLTFGVYAYEISLQDFNLGKTSASGRNCVGGILAMGNDFPPNLAIIGAEFLKSWYSIYDYDHGTRVGFAKSINNN